MCCFVHRYHSWETPKSEIIPSVKTEYPLVFNVDTRRTFQTRSCINCGKLQERTISKVEISREIPGLQNAYAMDEVEPCIDPGMHT